MLCPIAPQADMYPVGGRVFEQDASGHGFLPGSSTVSSEYRADRVLTAALASAMFVIGTGMMRSFTYRPSAPPACTRRRPEQSDLISHQPNGPPDNSLYGLAP